MTLAPHDALPTYGVPSPRTGAPAHRARRMPRVAVVGLGYVGLPTALALLEAGSEVVGLDVSDRRRAAVAAGDVDLLPADHARLARHNGSPAFSVSGDAAVLSTADVVVVCVPTPVDEHLVPDLTALRAACATVAARAVPGQLLVLTSTTYVGTTRDLLVEPLVERGMTAGRDLSVAFSPERIDPGNARFPVERTPRVVGGATPLCAEKARSFLSLTAPLVHVVSSCETAEMTKLHENTFRAVNIAYANEMADVCAELGLDVTEVIDAAASKPYGFLPFRPGPGVGGHCIPCDPHYLLWQLRARRVEAPLIEASMKAIAGRPGSVVRRVREALADLGVAVRGARVLVIGVTYKPGVADVRESPALEILTSLVGAGAQVGFVDPYVDEVRAGSTVLTGEVDLDPESWDVALVHTAHPGVNVSALLGRVPVVDATFSLARTGR